MPAEAFTIVTTAVAGADGRFTPGAKVLRGDAVPNGWLAANQDRDTAEEAFAYAAKQVQGAIAMLDDPMGQISPPL